MLFKGQEGGCYRVVLSGVSLVNLTPVCTKSLVDSHGRCQRTQT